MMSRENDWADEPRDDRESWQNGGSNQFSSEHQFDPYGEPKRPGMSTGMKVFLVILCLGGISFILCCGGIFLWFNSLQKGMTEDPQEIVARTKEIAEIELSDEFEPKFAMNLDMFIFAINAVVYETAASEGALILAEMNMEVEDAQMDPEEQIRESVEKIQGSENQDLTITNTENKEFEIRGKKVEFVFAEAEDEDGAAFRQVTGTFPGKEGTAFLMLIVPEDQFDEETTINLIESIK